MPLYDFFCETCEKSFEELVSPHEVPPCPHCSGHNIVRKISAPSPLKTGAFPYKVGPVHPIAHRQTARCPKAGSCGSSTGFS